MTSLSDRCENWADCYRMRMRYNRATSFEGSYRSPQGEHWLFGAAPPTTSRFVDAFDAVEINSAWQSIGDAFHQFLLAAHYVRRWSPGKCVREAREFGGRVTARLTVSEAEFEANLGMAHALLAEQLLLPAVCRRERLTERIRVALDLDHWLAADAIAGDAEEAEA